MSTFMSDQQYYIGANYWASHAAIRMWSDWRADVVDSDFEKLAAHGVRTLRVFLLWPDFQPLKAIMANARVYEYRMMPGERPLPDTEAGRAGVSEDACEHFAELCRLADRHGIGLIVGLLTGHMSYRFFSPEAFEGKNFLTDPTVLKWEIRFVRYFVKRFRNEAAICAWDLGNECSNYTPIEPDQSYIWTSCITAAIRESDSTRPVVSGLSRFPLDGESFNVREHAENVDILTTHPYQIFAATAIDPLDTVRPELDPAVRATLYEGIGGKPAFIEETGSIGYHNCSEKTEAAFLRAMLFSTWSQGNRGLFWWCAFDQGSLDFAPYDWNNYGSDYGLFREDGSPKPTALVMREFDEFLKSYAYAELPPHTVEAVCIIPREMGDPLKTVNSAFLLAKQANLDIRFTHAEEKLPDSELYIMPSVYSNKPIFLRRLNELLERVRNGASWYLSLGDTLFRRIPELTGLTIASREFGGEDTVTLDGESFDFKTTYQYNIEAIADSCEVLATASDGTPVFVRNRYGKGYIYFLSLPLEAILAERPGVFKGTDSKPYYRFYEKFASAALKNSPRVIRCAHPCVLTTEHIVNANKRIVVAVNYADTAVETGIGIADGWTVSKCLRGEYSENLKLGACDGVVLELTK